MKTPLITIFGGTGGLGSQIAKAFPTPFHEVHALGRKECNIKNVYAVDKYFYENKSDIVLFFNNINHNGMMHKIEDAQIHEMVSNNITGTTYAMRCALKNMRDQGYGRIIYASSITVDKNVVGTAVYAATKAYFENLVKTIALENASKGITANCIQLGYMDGGLTYTLPEDLLKQKLQEIPAHRLGTINEITSTIQFLIQNEYVNGSTIKLTGGL